MVTEGAVPYETALRLTFWERSVIADEAERFLEEARRQADKAAKRR